MRSMRYRQMFAPWGLQRAGGGKGSLQLLHSMQTGGVTCFLHETISFQEQTNLNNNQTSCLILQKYVFLVNKLLVRQYVNFFFKFCWP